VSTEYPPSSSAQAGDGRCGGPFASH